MKVIQARPLRANQVLPVMWIVAVALVVETDPRAGVVAVGSHLCGGQRTVFVEPAHRTDRLLVPAVAEEVEPIGLGRMHPVFGLLARLNALGPHVADQAVAEQPELGRLVDRQRDRRPLRREAVAAERDAVLALGQIGPHRAVSQRSDLHRFAAGHLEQYRHIVQRDVAFVADVTNQHLVGPRTGLVKKRSGLIEICDPAGVNRRPPPPVPSGASDRL